MGSARLAALHLIALLGMATTALAAEPTPARRGSDTAEPIDAEMLRDLDLLQSPDYARDREVARQVRLLERLRMLEKLRALESSAPADLTAKPAGSSPREVK